MGKRVGAVGFVGSPRQSYFSHYRGGRGGATIMPHQLFVMPLNYMGGYSLRSCCSSGCLGVAFVVWMLGWLGYFRRLGPKDKRS